MSQVRVAVTGITGYLGAQITADLLAQGYIVHGTLRNYSSTRVDHFENIASEQIKFFEADLLTPNSFDKVVIGCTYAIHVASPTSLEAEDPQKEIVDPAVNGTLSFLQSCHKAGVKKVVLTSSILAMSGKGEKFNESAWNTDSTLQILPYFYSKAQAEKAAWKYVEEEAPDMKLVVINPSYIFGPSLTQLHGAVGLIFRVMFKEQASAIFDHQVPAVDIRDVSEAHIRAMQNDNAAGRYIVSHPEVVSMEYVMDCWREAGYQLSRKDMTSSFFTQILKLVSYFNPGGQAGIYIRKFFGNPLLPDSSKSTRELGLVYRDMKITCMDTIKDFIDKGLVSPPDAETLTNTSN